MDADDNEGVTPTNLGDPLAQTLAAWGGATACLPVPPTGTGTPLPPADQRTLTTTWATAFLDGVLRGDASGLDALETTSDPRVDVRFAK
jgi:hypothetical protein